jgi:spermidine synthase
VIGLGSGDTPFSLGGREETTSVTCIEIVKPQEATLRLLQDRRPYGGLESLLNDSRFQFVFTDGRSYIGSRTKTYDVIEADALRPNSAFAGNLYSYEYFLLLKSRLKPGGLAVTWAPTIRVIETFLRVFPHAYTFDGVLIGSADPIPYDPEVIRRRLEHPFTRAYYAKAGIDAKALVLPLLSRRLKDVEINRSHFAMYDINTDLHPKDEYSRP